MQSEKASEDCFEKTLAQEMILQVNDTEHSLDDDEDEDYDLVNIDTVLSKSPSSVPLFPFTNQVGGHAAFLRFSEKAVCKPLNEREKDFYKSTENFDPSLKEFIPIYLGVVNVSLPVMVNNENKGVNTTSLHQSTGNNNDGLNDSNGNIRSSQDSRASSASTTNNVATAPELVLEKNKHIFAGLRQRPPSNHRKSQHVRSRSSDSARRSKPSVVNEEVSGLTTGEKLSKVASRSSTSFHKSAMRTESSSLDSSGGSDPNLAQEFSLTQRDAVLKEETTIGNVDEDDEANLSPNEISRRFQYQVFRDAFSPKSRRTWEVQYKNSFAQLFKQTELPSVPTSPSPSPRTFDATSEKMKDLTLKDSDSSRGNTKSFSAPPKRSSMPALYSSSCPEENVHNLINEENDADDEMAVIHPNDANNRDGFFNPWSLQTYRNMFLKLFTNPASKAPSELITSPTNPQSNQSSNNNSTSPSSNRAGATSESDRTFQFIMLQDLTDGMRWPCILDLKMGVRQYGINVSAKKKESQTKKAMKTTSHSLGVRVCGMQDKYDGRSLNEQQFKDTLVKFFFNGKVVLYHFIPTILAKLEKLKSLVKDRLHHYRFYSSSLLLLYDGFFEGDYSNLNDKLKQEKLQEDQKHDSSRNSPNSQPSDLPSPIQENPPQFPADNNINNNHNDGINRLSSIPGKQFSNPIKSLRLKKNPPISNYKSRKLDLRIIDFAHSVSPVNWQQSVEVDEELRNEGENNFDAGYVKGLESLQQCLREIYAEFGPPSSAAI